MSQKKRLLKELYAPTAEKRAKRLEAINAHLCVRFDPDMGFRLSIIRRKMGLRQEDLARNLGVSRQALNKVESGKTSLTNIGYLQLRSAIDRPGKNFLNFLFLGPPRSKWFEFQRFTSLRAAGAKVEGSALEIINGYEMI